MKLCKLVVGILLGALSSTAVAQNAATKSSAAAQPATAAAKSEPLTAEQEKLVKAMMKQTMKSFTDAALTADQEKKADEIFSKAIKEVVLKRSAAKITPELQKKQAAGMKEARESGKKPKEQAAAAFASAGFNDDQVRVFKETQETLTKAKREFAKSLKAEQVQKLPEQMQKMLKRSA